jgi:hypothetical protein
MKSIVSLYGLDLNPKGFHILFGLVRLGCVRSIFQGV